MGMRRICCLPGVEISLVLFFLCALSGLSDIATNANELDSLPTPVVADFRMATILNDEIIRLLNKEIWTTRDAWLKLGGLTRVVLGEISQVEPAAGGGKHWRQARDSFWKGGQLIFAECWEHSVFARCLWHVKKHFQSLREMLSDPQKAPNIDTQFAVLYATAIEDVKTGLRRRHNFYKKRVLDVLRMTVVEQRITPQIFTNRVYDNIRIVVGILDDTIRQLNDGRNRPEDG